MTWPLIIIVAVIVILGIWLAASYNRLTKSRIRLDNSWSQINVQLKMRADLVPNLVNTVKGYATHEQDTLREVVAARSRFMSAETPEATMESGNEIANLMGRLFALAEQYPDLKANSSFLDLQSQLSEIEKKIAMSRQFYNDAVMLYNRQVRVFPGNIAAAIFGFRERPYFEIDQVEAQSPVVEF
ncbi:MAG: LemA family protein [Fastidiosipila sp.]|nr:LemA family protein [Fastidiosipila sp.]